LWIDIITTKSKDRCVQDNQQLTGWREICVEVLTTLTKKLGLSRLPFSIAAHDGKPEAGSNMDEENEVKGGLDQLKCQFDIISCVHEGDNPLKPEHTNKFKHGKQLNVSANGIHKVAEELVNGHGCKDIDDEHALQILVANITDRADLFAGLRVLIRCSEVQDDVDEE
jgi:hypothetical protein